MPVAVDPTAGAPVTGLAIEPTPAEARELALRSAPGGGTYNLIPLRHSFIDDCETPVSAFLKLRALAPNEPAFLLESADQGQRVGRWSFIGFRPRSVLRWSLGDGDGGGKSDESAGADRGGGGDRAARADRDASDGGRAEADVAADPRETDPYALAARHVGRFRQAPMSDAPPFAGGAVGFFGYDLVRTVEPLGAPNPDVLGLPDMALMLSDALVIFDHLKHTVTILVNADLEAEPDVGLAYATAARTIAQLREQLAGPVPRAGSLPGDGTPLEGLEPGTPPDGLEPGVRSAGATRKMPDFEPNMPREQFEAMVERIVGYIYAGDAFQVVPSQRWSAAVPVEAFSIYRGLRAVNPSPYMYFLDFGDFQVAGASPEPLLTVSRGGDGRARVSTRPIAGTRSRGADAQADERIARELLEDPKERAEHVMLVDLGRNDLGRVCEAGSVEVETFMAVETYSHVMHIVSSVAGVLREGVTPMDALRSALPAGTLSGAPKVRAMQIIDELEPVKRGGYGGAIGYLSYGGDLDTCIHIRTVVVKDGVAHIQAGGGTVADAKPEYEYEESRAKSRAVLRAIELAIAQPDWP